MPDDIDVNTCGSKGGQGFPPLNPETDPRESIIVRSAPGITVGNKIVELEENNKKVYELRDDVLVKPIVDFTSDAAITEIGDTITTLTFDGEIAAGSNDIDSRLISPDPGGLDLTAPFTFEKSNVTRNTPGTEELHTLSATDILGNTTEKTAGAPFKHALYQGFSTAGSLNATQIKALVNKHLIDKIIDQYGGEKDYVIPSIPAGLKYIYWVYPVGTQQIQGITLSGLPFPITFLSNVTVVNDFGVEVEYVVVRSSNRFGSTTLTLTLS